MGRVRVSRAGRARLGVLLGGVLVAVGVGLAVGVAAALIVAGAGLVAYCLLLADVDPPQPTVAEDVDDQEPAVEDEPPGPPGAAVDLLDQPLTGDGRRAW